jgi:plastocyanin/predicted DNA-binding antitoxin AbrB/MazE fold protein
MKVKKSLTAVAGASLLVFALPILVGAQTMDSGTSTQAFTDVSASSPYYNAVTYLKAHGVISGYADGTFKPDQQVNRAEALKIILLGSGIQVPASVDLEPFRDTDRTAWYAPYVAQAKTLNIVSGYADGTFKPAQTVNMVENLKILLMTKKVDLSTVIAASNPYADALTGQWYTPYVEYAKEKNLIDADNKNMIYPSQPMTRGKLADAMYRLMYMNDMGWSTYTAGGNTQSQQTISTTEQPATTQQAAFTQELTEQTTQQTTQEATQQTTQQSAPAVTISNYAFSPAVIQVAAGTTVVWTNQDAVAHTVTSDDGTSFSSSTIANGATFSYTFNTPGTFTYHCSIHPMMTGTVTVS